MKRTFQSLAAAAVASTLLLTGCSAGGSPSGDATGDSITLWLAGSDTPDELRDYLKTDKNVESFHDAEANQGGHGVTIVNVKR